MNEERSRLSRWSQRKAAAKRGEAVPEPAEDVPLAQDASLEPEHTLPDAEATAADDDMPVLPPIEELTAESDYTVFLGEKVPEALRRAALRKLWTSDPVLANLDGLNDYDEDYNLVATALGAVQSAWQAGSGYAERAEETLEKVEETLGSSEGPQSESRQQAEALQDESQAASESERASQDREALGESDAAGDSSADALRRVADPAADPSPDVPPEQSDK